MQFAAEPQRRVADVYLANVELPLSAAYYPAGFPLHLSTNSRDVLESARESWGAWSREFDRPPVKLRVAVQQDGALAPAPAFRRQGHLFCVVSDADNFGVGDMRLLESCVFVSAQTAADHAWFRWYFLEPLGYVMLAQRYVMPVHAACVAYEGSGVLLCGTSGAGKSTLSFACARAGWTYLSDDATWLLPESGDSTVIGRPQQARFRPDAPALFPELAAYSERVRPNGKLSLEVDLRELPHIATTTKCAIDQLVVLDRKSELPPRLEKMRAEEAVELLLQDGGGFGEEVDRLRENTVRRLLRLPAYRLQYERLDDALELLSRLKK